MLITTMKVIHIDTMEKGKFSGSVCHLCLPNSILINHYPLPIHYAPSSATCLLKLICTAVVVGA